MELNYLYTIKGVCDKVEFTSSTAEMSMIAKAAAEHADENGFWPQNQSSVVLWLSSQNHKDGFATFEAIRKIRIEYDVDKRI